MLSFICANSASIVVGIVVALVLVGGFGSYVGYKIWAKKHGKSSCGCNCSACAYCKHCEASQKYNTKQR